MEEIIINFDEQGNPDISVQGVKGKVCTDITKFLETALGNKQSDIKTREYYEHVDQRIHIKR